MNREEAEQLLDEFHVPVNVRAHSLQVARIGEFLAQKLIEAGEEVDVETVWIAGIIHDFVRVVDFDKIPKEGNEEDQLVWKELQKAHQGHHADIAAEILYEREEEGLAALVGKHRYTSITDVNAPTTWEEKLLYYADKRVAHDEIVSLQERLDEGKKRHFPNTPIDEEEEARREKIFALEKEIFEKINMSPDKLAQALGE